MNEPTPDAPQPASTPPKTAGNPAVSWAIRIVVFGALGGLLVVAVLHFTVKRKFEASQNAIIDKFSSTTGMKLKDAEELLEGDPEVAVGKGDDIYAVKIYTWKTPITEYKLRIKYAKTLKLIKRVSSKDDDEAEDE